MAEEFPVAPARMASLREKDKNGSSEKEKKRGGWFGKNKGTVCMYVPGAVPLGLEAQHSLPVESGSCRVSVLYWLAKEH